MAEFDFKVINYTGFTAYNIEIDASFMGAWIVEWVKNAAKGLEAQKNAGTVLSEDLEGQLASYKEQVNNKNSRILKANETLNVGPFIGSFAFDDTKTNFIKVRVSWDSENKAHFEKIFSFKIEKSQAYGSYSYIPIPIKSE